MKAKVIATFIGGVSSSFKNDKGEEIPYRQGMFAVLGEMEAPVFSIPEDVSLASLTPGQVAYMVVDFRYNSQFKNFKGRVAALYPDEKALAAAKLDDAPHPEPGTYAASMQHPIKPESK